MIKSLHIFAWSNCVMTMNPNRNTLLQKKSAIVTIDPNMYIFRQQQLPTPIFFLKFFSFFLDENWNTVTSFGTLPPGHLLN